MPAVASGVLCAWPGAASAIPAGWIRQDGLAGQYVHGAAAGVDPGTFGGSATHTHASDVHSHAVGAHSHAGGQTSYPTISTGTALYIGAPFQGAHDHLAGATSGTSGGADTLATAAAGWAASANDPQNLTVIWIQSDGTPTGFPPYALTMWNSATLPIGWMQHPALKGGYLKGAAASTDGGIASAGNTHSHMIAAHTHGASSGHTHTQSGSTGAVTVDPNQLGYQSGSGVTTGLATTTHTHTISSPTTSALDQVTSASGTGTSASQAVQPPYYTIIHIQNASGAPSLPINIIAVWTGTLASIPSGWVLCNGANSTPDLRGQFPRGANALSELGTTGGVTGHGHATGAGHTHPLQGHTHTFSTGNTNAGVTTTGGAGIDVINEPHGHQGSTAVSLGTTDPAAMDCLTTTDTRPPFYDVAFIQYQVSNTVTVTTPTAAQVFALPSFTAAWTLGSGTQVTKRAVVYANDGVTVVYDSGTITSATASQLIPAGFLVNGTSYKFQVTITDTNGATAQSSQIAFSTSWTNPAGVGGLAVTPSGGT